MEGESMQIELRDRTIENVKIYFEKTSDEEINWLFPRGVSTLKEAMENYKKSLSPQANSYGKTIYVDSNYIGDVWCYCIEKNETPEAMISFCIFDKSFWGKGLTTKAVSLFINEVCKKYQLKTIGAFCYSDNLASIRVLEKNGFTLEETFMENGRESKYFLRYHELD